MNQRQKKFVENYFNSSTLLETCQKSNVSYPTALKWLKAGEVKQEIENRYRAISKKNLQESEKLLQLSTKELMEIISNKDSKQTVKLQAINIALNMVFKSREFLDLENSIEILNKE